MTRTAITRTAITETGFNLTDATFSTLSTGSGNGVSFAYRENDIVALKNDTGGAAEFTIEIPQPSNYDDKNVTIPDASVTVADGKTYLYSESVIFRQTDGDIYIDCDVAGKALVIATGE